MRRPRQHITDARGDAQLRRVFADAGWAVNRTEHDYGADYEIEVFRAGRSTGITFKVQLKSSENTAYSADASFVSVRLSVPQARYLAQELRAPVVLIHADVAGGKTFWTAPQLDVDLARDVANANDDKADITIRVATANDLPDTLGTLAEAVAATATTLAARLVATTPVPQFMRALNRTVQTPETLKGLQQKVEALHIEGGHRLLLAGKLPEATEHIAAVLANPSASVDGKFGAILLREMVEGERLAHLPGGDEPYHRMMVDTARSLRELVRKGPSHLKFYALIQQRAAELDWLVHRNWCTYLALTSRPPGTDPLLIAQLRHSQARLARRINEEYRQAVRLMNYAAASRYRAFLVPPIVRVAEALPSLQIRFRHENQQAAARRVGELVIEICRLAAALAREANDDENLVRIAATAAMTADSDESAENRWATELAASILDPDKRRAAFEFIERSARGRRGEKDPRAKRADARQITENIAMGLGIQPNDFPDTRTT